MADTLMLRKGLLAGLKNAPIVNGAIDITLDEKAMYVCHNGERVRLGDFVEVANVTELKSLEAEWRTSALYYVVADNALLKYNKTGTKNEVGSTAEYQWVQINEVSDLAADISDLTGRMDTAEGNITNLQTAHAAINIALTGDVTGTATINSNNKLTVTTDIGTTGVSAKAYGPTEGGAVAHKGAITVPNFTVAADGRLTAAGSISYTLPGVDDITGDISDLQTAVQDNADNIKDIVDEIGINTSGNETGIYKYAKDKAAAALGSAQTYADQAETDAVNTAKGYTDTEVKKVSDVVTGHTGDITNLQNAHAAINVTLSGDVTGSGTIGTNNKITISNINITDTNVTANSYGPATGGAVKHEGSITVPNFTVASDGRLTAAGSVTYTLPSVDDITGDITSLQGAVQTNSENIAKNAKAVTDEAAAARAAEKALGERIDQEITNRGQAITSAVNTLNGTIGGINTRVGTAETNITNLQNAIGSQKSGNTAATGLYKYIDDQDAATLQAAETKIATALAAADAMTFMGVVDSSNALPSAGNKGDTYKVGAKGDYAGYTCYVGDLLICKGDNSSEWWHVSSGYEDDYDPYLSATNNTVTLKNTVGTAKGAITVTGDYTGTVTNGVTAGGTQVNTNISTDPSTGISNITYTVSTVWGSF